MRTKNVPAGRRAPTGKGKALPPPAAPPPVGGLAEPEMVDRLQRGVGTPHDLFTAIQRVCEEPLVFDRDKNLLPFNPAPPRPGTSAGVAARCELYNEGFRPVPPLGTADLWADEDLVCGYTTEGLVVVLYTRDEYDQVRQERILECVRQSIEANKTVSVKKRKK